MRRLSKAFRFGLLNSLVLCICFIVLKGLHEGWESIRVTNPPVPELIFFSVVTVIQTCFGWMLVPADGAFGKTPHREL